MSIMKAFRKNNLNSMKYVPMICANFIVNVIVFSEEKKIGITFLPSVLRIGILRENDML